MRIEVNGVRLYFDVEGVGLAPDGPTMTQRPTLLLLHGGPGADHSGFKPIMSAFADRAQIVYLDYRGNGRSDVGSRQDWTLAQWVADLKGFMEALEIECPMMLGISFGGLLAQAFAIAHPDLVSRLALVSTGARSDVELCARTFEALGGPLIGDIARRYFAQSGDEDAEAAFMAQCLPYYSVKDFNTEMMARIVHRPEVREHFFGKGGEFESLDFRPLLPRVTCPTLVLHGARDPALPLPLAREIHEALPAGLSRLHVIENCGHTIFDDAPDEAMTALSGFLFEE